MEPSGDRRGFPDFLKVYLLCRRSAERLQICDAFLESLDHLLPKRMILLRRGIDVGRKSWHVKIVELDGHVYIEGGWPKFVRDNRIEVGDILAFRYIRGLAFQVVVFGKSMCEKEAVVDSSRDSDSRDDDNIDEDEGDSVAEEVLVIDEDEGDSVAEEVPVVEQIEKAHGKQKVRNGGSRSNIASQEYFPEVEKYVDVRNPFFITRLRNNRKNCLHIPWQVIEDYNLELSAMVTFEDPHGRSWKGELKNWSDGRTWISGWGAVHRCNNIGPNDTIICEFLTREGITARVVKIHVVPDRMAKEIRCMS